MIQKFRYAVLEFLLPSTKEANFKSMNEMKPPFFLIHKSALLAKAEAEVEFSSVPLI